MARQPKEIAAGVYWLSIRGSNIYFVRSGASWALIDTAWPNRGRLIRKTAESLFGAGARPASILLTHDHPDHSGSALELARMWSLPVHVHRDELPLVNGSARDYPLPILPHEPDPPVGGFMILFAILLAPLHRSLFRSVTGTCVDARGVAARQRK